MTAADRTPPLPVPRDLAAELVDRGDGWHVLPEMLAEARAEGRAAGLAATAEALRDALAVGETPDRPTCGAHPPYSDGERWTCAKPPHLDDHEDDGMTWAQAATTVREASEASDAKRTALAEREARPELDDVDCCIRHHVQWANGRPQTGRCSEAVDPEQVAATTPAPAGARAPTGGTWGIEHSHVLAVRGLTVPCEPTCGIEQGRHEVRDVWRSDPRPLPKVAQPAGHPTHDDSGDENAPWPDVFRLDGEVKR